MFLSPISILLCENPFGAILRPQSYTNDSTSRKNLLILFMHKGVCTTVMLICHIQWTQAPLHLSHKMTELRRRCACRLCDGDFAWSPSSLSFYNIAEFVHREGLTCEANINQVYFKSCLCKGGRSG